MTNVLPYQLSEKTFRQYEHIIREAVKNAPDETSFTVPDNLSINTFIARIRDSIVSVKRYGWDTDIDLEKLWSMSGKFIWSMDPSGTKVWCREKQKRGRPAELVTEARVRTTAQSSPTHIVDTWTNPTKDQIEALCLLIHHQRIVGPVYLEGDVVTTLGIATNLDVAFTFDPSKNQTIVT